MLGACPLAAAGCDLSFRTSHRMRGSIFPCADPKPTGCRSPTWEAQLPVCTTTFAVIFSLREELAAALACGASAVARGA